MKAQKILVGPELMALRHIVGNDETRPYLGNIHLRKRAKKPVAIATDGHQMWAVEISGKEGEEIKTGGGFSAKILDKLKKRIGQKRRSEAFLSVLESGKVTVKYENDTLTEPAVEGGFNMDSVWPAADKDYQPVSFRAELLGRLVKMMNEAQAKTLTLWVPVNKDRTLNVTTIPASLGISLDGVRIDGLIMPARGANRQFPAGVK